MPYSHESAFIAGIFWVHINSVCGVMLSQNIVHEKDLGNSYNASKHNNRKSIIKWKKNKPNSLYYKLVFGLICTFYKFVLMTMGEKTKNRPLKYGHFSFNQSINQSSLYLSLHFRIAKIGPPRPYTKHHKQLFRGDRS